MGFVWCQEPNYANLNIYMMEFLNLKKMMPWVLAEGHSAPPGGGGVGDILCDNPLTGHYLECIILVNLCDAVNKQLKET